MLSLFLRNLFFTILQPGVVAVLVPYLLAGEKRMELFLPWDAPHWIGAVITLAGTVIVLTCITLFAMQGRGTLSPADPTKALVIKGLYRYSRNPMYVGVMLMLIGESIFIQRQPMWIYTMAVFTAFHIFIVSFEEPRLRKDFGEEYNAYCKKVKRWL